VVEPVWEPGVEPGVEPVVEPSPMMVLSYLNSIASLQR